MTETVSAMERPWTTGPWRFVPWHVEEAESAVRAPEGWLICTTSSEANAKLIAAAPEMAEALETASWLLADISPDGLVKRKVDAALAKARGEQA